MQVGVDIIAVKRIEAAIEKHGERFLARFMHTQEKERAQKIETIAGVWAAKEAAAKALGCGIGKALGFHDIVIDKRANGQPMLLFAEEVTKRFSIRSSSLSISHDAGMVVAVALIDFAS